MKQVVVLDKSFVRDASAVRIAEICETYRAMMIQDLAFELIKDDQETRVEYFRKFPQRSNPFELIENVGSLLRYEIEYRRPCTPIWEHRVRKAFSINKGLVEGDFDLNSRQANAVREWEGQLSESLQSFVERGETADQIFPELKGFRPGQDKEPIRRLVERIGTDIEWIKQKYSEMVPAEFPPSQIVGRTWASFRWLQVHLIAAVEYFSVYGPGINKTNRETLENERTDNVSETSQLSESKGLAT